MSLTPSYKYNIIFVFISHALMAFSAGWGVVHIIFYRDIGLDFVDISMIISMSSLAGLIFEMPTGIFTDLYGRKISIILSFFVCVMGSVLAISADSFFDVSVMAVLYGLSYALWSGSYEAMVFESLRKMGKGDSFSYVLSKSNFVFVAFGILTNYLIPVVYGMDMRYPFYLTVGVGVVLLILSSFLTESETVTHERVKQHKVLDQVKVAYRFIVQRDFLLFIFAYGLVLGTSAGIFGALLNQPLVYKSYEMDDYGAIFAITTAIQSVIIFFTNNIIDFLKKYNPYFVMLLVWCLSLGLMVQWVGNIYVLVPVMAVSWSVGSIVYVLTSNDMNPMIDDEIRATVISANSMVKSLFFSLALLGSGLVMESITSVQHVTLLLSFATLLAGLLVLKVFAEKIKMGTVGGLD